MTAVCRIAQSNVVPKQITPCRLMCRCIILIPEYFHQNPLATNLACNLVAEGALHCLQQLDSPHSGLILILKTAKVKSNEVLQASANIVQFSEMIFADFQ